MADSDKNILITPNRGSSTELPKIEFTGADPNTISLSVLDDGTLSFSGSSGQLFSISDSLTGTIFSVNDVSGIPSIEVDDDGTIRFAEFAGNVLVGTNSDNGTDKLQVNGSVVTTGLHIDSTGAVELPTGTEAQRPTPVAGMFRFNTEESEFEGYDGTEWGAIGGGGGYQFSTTVFTATANQTLFTVGYTVGTVAVFLNGVQLVPTTDYTATNGTSITLVAPASEDDVVMVQTFNTVQEEAGSATLSTTTLNVTSEQSVFTVGYSPAAVNVYLNGVQLVPSDDYTATNGTSITLTTAAVSGDVLVVQSFTSFEVANAITQEIADGRYAQLANQTNYTNTATSKTLVKNEKCLVTASGQTITLPANPSEDDVVGVIVENFTDTVVARNGSTIMELAEDLTLDKEYLSLDLVYQSGSWRFV